MIAFDLLVYALMFVIILWAFFLAFILGAFLPFVVACKLLFNRDLIKVIHDGFADPFTGN